MATTISPASIGNDYDVVSFSGSSKFCYHHHSYSNNSPHSLQHYHNQKYPRQRKMKLTTTTPCNIDDSTSVQAILNPSIKDDCHSSKMIFRIFVEVPLCDLEPKFLLRNVFSENRITSSVESQKSHKTDHNCSPKMTINTHHRLHCPSLLPSPSSMSEMALNLNDCSFRTNNENGRVFNDIPHTNAHHFNHFVSLSKFPEDLIPSFISRYNFNSIHHHHSSNKSTLMGSTSEKMHLKSILQILISFLILFTLPCNTQLISIDGDGDHHHINARRSLTDVTTTEHSKINPSYTLHDYNQLIRQQTFNNPNLYCGDPPLVPNAQSNLHRNQKHYVYPIGQEASYLCEQGYVAVSGNSETKCIIEGINFQSKNGQIIFPDVFPANSPTQTVRQGSNRSKNSKRLSDLDEEPDVNANGAKMPQSDFIDKRKMSRKTDDELGDYESQANSKKFQARWSPLITLNCQLVNCTDPGQVMHAKRNDPKSGIFSFNSNVHYVCEDGYETIGIPILTCRANGTWNRSPPQCHLKQCEMLPGLKNGLILYSEQDRRTNSRAEYRCNPGYRLNAATTTRLCKGDDNWSLLEPLLYMSNINNNTNHSNDSYQCLPILCPTPVRPHNGLRILDANRRQRNKNFFVPGDIIIYSCNSNRMRATAKCGPDGEWSQGVPHCPQDEFSSLKCAPITSFSHGSIKLIDDRAFFFCNEGYELDGLVYIRCNPEGIWSGPLPRCVVRMELPPKVLPPVLNTSHSPILFDEDSSPKEEHRISKTVMILLILIFIILFTLIGVAAVAFYRWRQRKLNSKTWQRYFGHYYHRQSKTNIVLSTHFVNGHGHSNGATIGSTGSSNANARLLQRGSSQGSQGFSKSTGYLQSSFSSADENNADVKSFTTETVTSDRARTISTYVDDTCVDDDEIFDEDEDNVSIYKSTTFPVSATQHNSLPPAILISPTSSSANNTSFNLHNHNHHNEMNAAKRTVNSGNNDHIYQNMFEPLAPVVVSPDIIENSVNHNSSKETNLFHTNGTIPVTDL